MHSIVEMPSYLRQAQRLRLNEDELDAIKAIIARQPSAGVIIPGSGGARKVRIRAKGRGKSGGHRVITFFSGVALPVFLLDIYSKSDKANMTRGEVNQLRTIIDAISQEYME
ncbi:MAG: type II toxin-antitoxin system RelE/ParE family toxin [Chloroflexi bacterium]|nr:type II toxin-antitoxin system RelE/ParE family toxin [Chloroflexota bacterium]